MQHITYNEWLPIILGSRVLEVFELKLLPRGYYSGYNESVNPTIANSFASAAFRFGHSLVKSSIDRCNREFRKVPFHVDLHKEINNPTIFIILDQLTGYCLSSLARSSPTTWFR
jgi:peroxidase